jgi:hypothetical protein
MSAILDRPSKAIGSTTHARTPSKWVLSLFGLLVIALLVGLRAASEWSMMRQFGPDPQMPIWGVFMVIKLALWSLAGVFTTGLLVAMRRRRYGRLAASFLFLVWAITICAASWSYQQARYALAAASDSSTSAERLQQLAHFDGIQAGYELDNRIAAHPNTPRETLRELYQRGQLSR